MTNEMMSLTMGRRASDRLIGAMLQDSFKRITTLPERRHILEAAVEPKEMRPVTRTPTTRRPRRTKAQLRKAMNEAVRLAQSQHPKWGERRIRTRAKWMVKKYEVLGY